jgi:hypothetical protein
VTKFLGTAIEVIPFAAAEKKRIAIAEASIFQASFPLREWLEGVSK